MSNSSLAKVKILSPNCNVRVEKITKVTVHHMAGNLSVESCGGVFANPARQASANYGIGTDGRIGLYVPENYRAWTSSSAWNDQKAVTIEVANDQIGGNWHVSDKAWNALVDLVTDICKRNGIKELTWTGDKNGSLTCHYMFAATACPGPYLKSRMAELAKKVTAKLNGSSASSGSSASKPSTPASKPTAPATSGGMKGTWRVNASVLNIRSKPSTSAPIVGKYYKGQTVNLENWTKNADGYAWGRYTAYSGNIRYVALGRATGKVESDDYLVKIN